jgi:hypothetical protein
VLEGRILVSLIMVVVFAIAVGLSFTYTPEARFLPLVIGIPGLLLSVVQLVKELRERGIAVVTPANGAFSPGSSALSAGWCCSVFPMPVLYWSRPFFTFPAGKSGMSP